MLWQSGTSAAACNNKCRMLVRAGDENVDLAAAGQGGHGACDHVQQQLDPVLQHMPRRTAPHEAVFSLANEPAGNLLCGTKVDHRAGRSRRTISKAGKLQPGRGLLSY